MQAEAREELRVAEEEVSRLLHDAGEASGDAPSRSATETNLFDDSDLEVPFFCAD